MLKVEHTGRCGRTDTESGRYGNEDVAGAASEAFARWLHHRYAPVTLPSVYPLKSPLPRRYQFIRTDLFCRCC